MSVLYYGIFSAAHFQIFVRPLLRLVDKHFFLGRESCYILPVTTTNVDEHFWLFYNLSTNTFRPLEGRRGKYTIRKYRAFFASVNKLSKWEKIGVCTNNGRLVIYEG